jgi:hypothetical protein
MSSSRNDWFPTPVWHFAIDAPTMNLNLLQEVQVEQQRDQTGEKWSNVLGWHSKPPAKV